MSASAKPISSTGSVVPVTTRRRAAHRRGVDVAGVQAQMLRDLRGPARAKDAVDPGDGDSRLVADVLDRLDMQLQRGLGRLGIADLVRLGRADDGGSL